MNCDTGASRRIVQKTQEDLYISAVELAEGLSTQSAQAKALSGSADTAKLHSYPNNPDGQKQYTHIYSVLCFF